MGGILMRNSKIFLVLTILTLSAFILSGCLPGEDDLGPELNVSTDFLNAEPGESATFMINNDGTEELDWEISTEEADWLNIDITEGSGTKQVTVYVDDEAEEDSNAKIKITSNGGNKEVDFLAGDSHVQKPKDFDARGITAPEGKVEDTIDDIEETKLASSSLNARTVDFGQLEEEEVPEGYETGYILSWKKSVNADGYELYEGDDEEKTLDPDDLEEEEIDGEVYYVYVDKTDDDIGTTKDYEIRAYEGDFESDVAEDTAGILPVTELETPADTKTVKVNNPEFNWDEVNNVAGYHFMLAEEDEEEIIFRENPDDAVYEYDKEDLEEDITYYWSILSVGEGEDAEGLSLSESWEFSVDLGE